jgi:NAD(P)-dependent dehydrogenase (short-subunit alcohol dehydrogenase family)
MPSPSTAPVAVVTGAARGIGRRVAEVLAAEGYAVAFLADPARSGFVNGVALPVDGGWTADASWTALRLRKR